jgi:sugar phosphate isomerase/epimerase
VRTKLAFSTLGCPAWDLARVAEAAERYGYDAIELRCLAGELDLSSRPELMPDEIDGTRARLERRGLRVCCVDSSAAFHAAEESERAQNVDTALRFAAIAAALGAPLLRVFPNEVPVGATRQDTRARIAESLRRLARGMPAGVRVGLETHGDFATAEAAVDLVRLADDPALAIVWDAANTVAAGEEIARSARLVAPFLALVHLRDARPVPGQRFWQPVLAGRGRVSFAGVIEALRDLDYSGYLSFEWEKYWHPELEEPEIALADFRAALRDLEQAA